MAPTTISKFKLVLVCTAGLLWAAADARPNERHRRQDTTGLPFPTFAIPTFSLPPIATLPPFTTLPPITTPPPVTTPLPPTTPPAEITTDPGPGDTVPPTLPIPPSESLTSPAITAPSVPTNATTVTDTIPPATETITGTDVTSTTTGTDVTGTDTVTGTDITATGTETATGTDTLSSATPPPVPSTTGSLDSGTATATESLSLSITGTDTATATDGPVTPPPPPPRTDTVTGDGITTTYVPSPPPVAPSLSQGRETASNSSVAADDPQVQLSGGNWEPAPVPPVPKCVGGGNSGGTGNATATAQRATQVGSKIEYSFVGTAIYLNTVVGPGGGVFTATIDGKRADVDTHRALASSTCEVTWSQWGLPNTNHQVTIEFRGASTDTTDPADAGLAIANFVVTKDESNAGLRSWAPSSGVPALTALFAAFFLFV